MARKLKLQLKHYFVLPTRNHGDVVEGPFGTEEELWGAINGEDEYWWEGLKTYPEDSMAILALSEAHAVAEFEEFWHKHWREEAWQKES